MSKEIKVVKFNHTDFKSNKVTFAKAEMGIIKMCRRQVGHFQRLNVIIRL